MFGCEKQAGFVWMPSPPCAHLFCCALMSQFCCRAQGLCILCQCAVCKFCATMSEFLVCFLFIFAPQNMFLRDSRRDRHRSGKTKTAEKKWHTGSRTLQWSDSNGNNQFIILKTFEEGNDYFDIGIKNVVIVTTAIFNTYLEMFALIVIYYQYYLFFKCMILMSK